MPVRKPDGRTRLCIDFRKLNSVTVADPYYMPRIDETVDKLGEAKFLSKIDLAKGFYQIQVDPRDIPKTAFVTPFGKFEFLRMPFGLQNAPTTFQRAMENILSELYEFSTPYIDDVVIYSLSWEDHLIHIDRVLKALD